MAGDGEFLLVHELSTPVFLSSKFFNDPGVKIRNVPYKPFLHGEHSQSIEALLSYCVPQEGFSASLWQAV